MCFSCVSLEGAVDDAYVMDSLPAWTVQLEHEGLLLLPGVPGSA
jgi:hypothetical protein